MMASWMPKCLSFSESWLSPLDSMRRKETPPGRPRRAFHFRGCEACPEIPHSFGRRRVPKRHTSRSRQHSPITYSTKSKPPTLGQTSKPLRNEEHEERKRLNQFFSLCSPVLRGLYQSFLFRFRSRSYGFFFAGALPLAG